MSISASDLEEITRTLATGDPEEAVKDLRSRFSKLAWTRCDALDVDEEPIATSGHFDLHLLDISSHCPEIVTDLERANGIVLAERMIDVPA